MTLTTPTVHLNGTSRKALADDYEASYRAIGAARDILSANPPNARDYYVQSGDAFSKALAEHHSRLQRLDDVRQELFTLWESVQK